MPLSVQRNSEMKRVSRKNKPCGREGSISPERLEMQNAEPSTSVTMPSDPMLALALLVQGSAIAEKLLPDTPHPDPTEQPGAAAGGHYIVRRCASQSSPRSGFPFLQPATAAS